MAFHIYSPNRKPGIIAICILLSSKTTQVQLLILFALCFFISLALCVFPSFSALCQPSQFFSPFL
jgi:hypothetical protein